MMRCVGFHRCPGEFELHVRGRGQEGEDCEREGGGQGQRPHQGGAGEVDGHDQGARQDHVGQEQPRAAPRRRGRHGRTVEEHRNHRATGNAAQTCR